MVLETIHGLTESQRLRLEDVLLILSVVTPFVALVGGMMRVAWKRVVLPQMTETISRIVRAETTELRLNGGASIKDSMGLLLAGQHDMREEMAGIKARLHQLEEPR